MSMPQPGVTEDSPPDLLAGSMELRVVLPCGSVARCHVDRSTPMMDLLVQLARAHRMPPSAHSLQPLGIGNAPLPFQPSTPVGALDVFTVKMVPKTRSIGPMAKRAAPAPKSAHQPFEQTFRLQVHLPRNQLFVMRASRATVLGDIQRQVCSEKNLDASKYELRHPANLEVRLCPESTLGECGLCEVALVSRIGIGSQPDLLALRRLGLGLVPHSMQMATEGSVSSVSSGSLGGRSTSPAPSDGDRSTSPLQLQPAVAPPPAPAPLAQPLGPPPPPSRPGRKRRPAPKPPALAPAPTPATELNNNISKDVESYPVIPISHSRNSSDSSGYHEASVLSESPEGGCGGNSDAGQGQGQAVVTRRSKLHSSTALSLPMSMSRSMTNLAAPLSHSQRHSIAVSGLGQGQGQGQGRAVHSVSTSSLSSAGQRKRKAPPPPVPSSNGSPNRDVFLKTQSLERHVPIAEALESPVKSSTLPACGSVPAPDPAPVGSSSCSPSPTPTPTPTPTHTPTPSEQSAHLSETNTTPAPRPVPRSVRSTPVVTATAPVPRPRPRKQLAPTPPLSPMEVNSKMSDSFVSVESTYGEEDTLSEGSSAVFEDPVISEETTSSKCYGADQHDVMKKVDVYLKLETNKTERDVNSEFCNSVIGNETLQSSRVRHQSLPHVVNKTGEEVDSDFCAEETNSNEKFKACSPPATLDRHQSILSKDKESTASTSPENVEVTQKSNEAMVPSNVEDEWVYHLPSPPSAFQDSCLHSLNGANESVSLDQPLSGREDKLADKETLQNNVEEVNNQANTIIQQNIASDVVDSKDLDKCFSIPSKEDEIPLLINTMPKQMLNKVSGTDGKEDDGMVQSSAELVKDQAPEIIRNKTVISTAKSVIRSTSVPNEDERKRLDGPAAVLDELNQVLNEQRSRHSSSSNSALQQSELVPLSSTPLENFSMSAYSQPASQTDGAPLEVRPSLVLARRSSFSNSNGSTNGTGVRRTTSHATLVGNRRDSGGSNDALEHSLTKSFESNNSSSGNYVRKNSSGERKPLGRASSEINLNTGLSLAPQLEPELLMEFMEWRKQRQKEQQYQEEKDKNKLTEAKTSNELQSPQVLRTILPQLNLAQDPSKQSTTEKQECAGSFIVEEQTIKSHEEPIETAKDTPVPSSTEVSEPVRRQPPRGPPSIQLSTWSERPKRQVSLKMDRDYRTGMGGAAPRPHPPPPPPPPGRDKVDGPEPHMEKMEKLIKDENKAQEQETVQRLTRQMIAHATPSGFRRVDSAPLINSAAEYAAGMLHNTYKSGAATTTQIIDERPELAQKAPNVLNSDSDTAAVEISLTSKNDPSRVPIVRAVELKKTSPQQSKGINNSVVYFSGPAASSTFSGKQVPQPPSTIMPLPVKKFTSVVDISGPITNDKAINGNSVNLSNVHVNGLSSNVEPKKTLPMPVVKGFKIAQGSMSRQLSAPAGTPAPPPLAPNMLLLRKVVRPTSLPPLQQDPRTQLLDAIRSFGGRTNLRPTT